MGRNDRSKMEKIVNAHDSRSSEENLDEDYPEVNRSASYLRTAENMLSASRKRREAKRKVIEAEHVERVEKARARIESFYENRRRKLLRLQSEQWEELNALRNTRTSIESAIFKIVTVIEQLTLNMANELDTMYAARLNDIVEMDTTGKILERD